MPIQPPNPTALSLPTAGQDRAPVRPIHLRPYQLDAFRSPAGVLTLHWSRQIGKSYTLATWAVTRLTQHPGRLVTVLSNSRENGAEFIRKCTEICERLSASFEQQDLSAGDLVENMRIECRVRTQGRRWGRIHALAANPRTARGFSGDLILDEFAFHENSEAIWDAAEPIISANPGYLCRVASTGNGRFNKFYQLASLGAHPARSADGRFPLSEAGSPVSRVTRSDAYALGVPIFDPATRAQITPAQARERALDKRSYDQNYECSFHEENMALLTLELIAAAESDHGCRLEERTWRRDTLDYLRSLPGPLGIGIDVGRSRDLTSICVGERQDGAIHLRALLRIAGMRLPDQLREIEPLLAMANFGRAEIDATGIGLGLAEFAQERVGGSRVGALNFASRERRPDASGAPHKGDSAPVTELMALDLLRAFEDRAIRIPCEAALRAALRKPERVQTASGVRIAVERDQAGHADEFWSLALMVRALSAPSQGLSDVSQVRLGARRDDHSFRPRRWSDRPSPGSGFDLAEALLP